jgi:hypothetical protein
MEARTQPVCRQRDVCRHCGDQAERIRVHHGTSSGLAAAEQPIPAVLPVRRLPPAAKRRIREPGGSQGAPAGARTYQLPRAGFTIAPPGPSREVPSLHVKLLLLLCLKQLTRLNAYILGSVIVLIIAPVAAKVRSCMRCTFACPGPGVGLRFTSQAVGWREDNGSHTLHLSLALTNADRS